MIQPGAHDRFYNDLTAFDRFDDVVDFAAYVPVPEDWVVMIADVEGSTAAIESGRYKDVNMVGAASITAVLNTRGEIELPYVFGGDGGTILVPGSLVDTASRALMDLRSVSREMFGLALRVGAVPVSDLRRKGVEVSVRKFQLSPGNHLAMIAGGGVERADRLIKSPETAEDYLIPEGGDASQPVLDGLSCRWEPLIPGNGRMMSLMVQATGDDAGVRGATLANVLTAIAEILGHDLRDSAPANTRSMRFKWPPSGLALEARATAGRSGFWPRYFAILASSLIQAWCERFDRRAGSYDAPVYREELRANTDFRKYDDMLRSVLDVTPDQATQIEAYLDTEYAAGRIVHGVHVADAALMTCLVFDLSRSEHMHFIDGGDGGFAMAATALKARVQAG